MEPLRKRIVTMMIATICSVLSFDMLSAPKLPSKPPQGGGDCATCHINWLSDYKKRNVDLLVKYQDTIIVDTGRQNITSTRRMCFTCHDGFVNDSRFQFRKDAHAHPVGVKPSSKIKILKSKRGSNYPLNEDGKLYCGSCHSAHGTDWNKNKSAIFMRSPNVNSSMCIDCHENHNNDSQENHPLPSDTEKRSRDILKAGGKYGDNNRIICQTCHKSHDSNGKNLLVVDNSQQSSLCSSCHTDKKQLVNSEHNMMKKNKAYKNSKHQKLENAGPCAACHISHGGHGKPLLATIRPKGRTDVWSQCLSCHRKKGVAGEASIGRFTHPTGVSLADVGIKVVNGEWQVKNVSKRSLAQLPLYDKHGKSEQNDKVMQCPTCHDPHQSSKQNQHFLRLQVGNNSRLCTNCHQREARVINSKHNTGLYTGKKQKDMAKHNTKLNGVCGTCHNAHNGVAANILNTRSTHKGDTSSAITQFCNNCHAKGRVASSSQVGLHSHPISVRLADNMKSGKLPLFSPTGEAIDIPVSNSVRDSTSTTIMELVEELDEEPAVKIRDNRRHKSLSSVLQLGLVDCATCHNVHQWDPDNPASKSGRDTKTPGDNGNSFLRLSANEDSTLCVTCHEQQSQVIATDHDMRVTAKWSLKKNHQKIKSTGVCAQCHDAHDSKSSATLWSRDKASGKDEQSSLCLGCHRENKTARDKLVPTGRHPIKVVAWPTSKRKLVKNVTSELTPVFNKLGKSSSQGIISCPSCHDPHIWQSSLVSKGTGKNREGDLSNSFLRNRSVANMVCADCHGLDAIFRYQYFHSEKSTVDHSLYID